VFAAASLTEAFRAMAPSFEARHPGVDVELTFAGSSSLARQIEQGATADVFVSADEPTMREVVEARQVLPARTMARNRLALIVAKGNPKRISGLADLARPDVVFVACAPKVPCGRVAEEALRSADVHVRPRSLETDVKAVVAKVVLGEADAGIVYATDVKAVAGKADGLPVPSADRAGVMAVYLVAVSRHARNGDAARSWVDFVLSDDGQATLLAHGFLPP
jgi:molybdate transport system substrate-binding protein